MAGRKPTPTHLKLVKGNPGRRPIAASEVTAKAEAPRPPTHLSDDARKLWNKTVKMLFDAGVLARADAIAVEMLCEAYADYHAATKELEAFGSHYYETKNQAGGSMHRAHPAVAVRRDADRRIRGWLAEFGMTPSARSRVNASPKDDVKKDPAAEFLG